MTTTSLAAEPRITTGSGLLVTSLTVRIPLPRGGTVHAATDISLSVPPGSVTALVGESGCGKSVIALAVLGMLPPTAVVRGSISANGLPAGQSRGRTVALVPQSAATHLTPVRTVRAHLVETIRAVGSRRTCAELLARAGLDGSVLDLYPHQLSGGMAQRVALAAALAGAPAVIVADEPTSQLDTALSDHVLALLRDCADRGAAVLLITHDLAALLRTGVADEVAVMYASRLMECGPAAEVLADPWHDYTRDLLAALPQNGLHPLPGTPPQLTDLPDECVYHLRRPGTRFSGGPTELVRSGRRAVRTPVGATR